MGAGLNFLEHCLPATWYLSNLIFRLSMGSYHSWAKFPLRIKTFSSRSVNPFALNGLWTSMYIVFFFSRLVTNNQLWAANFSQESSLGHSVVPQPMATLTIGEGNNGRAKRQLSHIHQPHSVTGESAWQLRLQYRQSDLWACYVIIFVYIAHLSHSVCIMLRNS